MNNLEEMAQPHLSLPLTGWQSATLGGYDSKPSDGCQTFHLLHGNGFCARTLEPLAAHTGPDDRWLFTDIPGHGRSPSPGRVQPDWNSMATVVADSIAARARGPVVGIGHSMGGVITLLAAAASPGLFSRIVLLDPVLFSSEILLTQRLLRKTGLWSRMRLVKAVQGRRAHWPDSATMKADLRSKGLYRHWTEEALDAFVAYATVPQADGLRLACDPWWEGSIFGSYPRGLWHAVRSVDCPVDIVVASDSYPFISRAVARARRLNERITAHEFSGTHCFPMEQPKLAAELVKRILEAK